MTDGLPALALLMDPTTDDVLQRPPRRPDEAMLGRRQWTAVIAIGLLETTVSLGGYWWALRYRSAGDAHNLVFSVLVFGEVLRAFAARGEAKVHFELGVLKNWRLVLVTVLTLSAQVAIHHLPFAQALFGIGPLSPADWGLALVLGLIPVTVIELTKLIRRLAPSRDHFAAAGASFAAR